MSGEAERSADTRLLFFVVVVSPYDLRLATASDAHLDLRPSSAMKYLNQRTRTRICTGTAMYII